jgi:signal transduction histidine kinase
LTNARKHAAGAAVEVRVSGAAGAGLNVTVRNGRPVGQASGEAMPGTGTGLVGLVERASLAGGRLEYGHSPDGGFEIRAWLPWQV